MPLADKMRPKKIEDMVGQRHIIGKGKVLNKIIENKSIPNMILYGPPGTGKTTLANIVANTTGKKYVKLNAVNCGVKEIKEIIDENKTIPCLNIFDYYAKRTMNKRYNYLFLGEFNNIKIIGHKSQFSLIYGIDEKDKFITKIKGLGNNFEDSFEGFKKNNFYGTYLLGPLTVINPYFTKYLMKTLNQDDKLDFEEESLEAYNYTLKEFENPKTNEKSNH